MAKFDPNELDALGARRTRIRAELKEVSELLAVAVPRAEKSGLIQAEIARRTGMTRESIAQLCKPAGERWQRGRRATDGSAPMA